ncbi:MAG: MotA/TolQ/ExbB proton channel family protein [Pirellulales bacterium]
MNVSRPHNMCCRRWRRVAFTGATTVLLACVAATAWAQSAPGSIAQGIDAATGSSEFGAGPPALNGIATVDNAADDTSAAIPTRSLLGIVHDGGLLMFPLLGCSFVLVIFVMERAASLRRGRVIPRPFVRRMMRQLREGKLECEEALELCEQNGSPVAQVFSAGLRRWGRPAVEVEQAIVDAGERVAARLRKHLAVINGVATVSPLLGLLGTVCGMISAFNTIAVSDAMGRPELLAAGIGEALITTAVGLTVAIPALIFYMFFVSRVDRHVIDLDGLGQELVSIVAGDAPTSRASTTRSRKAAA